MSLVTWKQQYYPRPANRVGKRSALAHSLRKWEGLTKEALRAHGLMTTELGDVTESAGYGEKYFNVDSASCALCVHYLQEDQLDYCTSCPLAQARGGVRCDEYSATLDGDRGHSPFSIFTSKGDARPMLRWLRKAQKRQQKQKGQQ